MSYEYWVVRYVPNPVRGEFVNVGVIAGDGDDWALRRVGGLDRASRIGGHLSETKAFFSRVELQIDSELAALESMLDGRRRDITRGVIEDLRIRMCNVVQISAPRPIRAATAAGAADFAFSIMVLEQATEGRRRAGTIARHRISDALARDSRLSEHVRRAQHLTVGRQHTRIDFAIADGEIRQLNHVWDFSVKSTEQLVERVRAWSFLVAQVRRGQSATLGEGSKTGVFTVPQDVTVNCLYTPATSERAHEQLEVARDAWDSIGVAAYPESSSELVVHEAHELIAA